VFLSANQTAQNQSSNKLIINNQKLKRTHLNQNYHTMKRILNSLALILIALLSVQTLKAQDISGKVLYQGDTSRPVGNVQVILKNIDLNTTETYTTSTNGYYEFVNVANGNYTMTGKTALPGGGVTYYDAVLVFLNILGYYQFTPMQFMASDVNGTGTITWSDYNLIVNHILFGTPFPVGPWKFESAAFTISNFKDGVPHGLGGTCSGDVGGTFVPTVHNTPALPIAQEGILNVSAGESFTTRILTHSDLSITGAGIIINYPSELLSIESVEFEGSDYQYNIENGQVRLVWGDPNTSPLNFSAGETFVTIHGVATSAFEKGMTAALSLDGNTSLMNPSNQEVNNLKFGSPIIKYDNPSLKLSNYPNPFTTSTKLSIYTPEEGNATIEIYSANGQLVKNIQAGSIAVGYHEISLDASQLAKGYYMCKMRIQTGSSELNNTIRLLKAE
jgi:hypothetical protein